MSTYKYETHLHTDETSPCGKVPADEVVRIYKKAGYTGIVVTDHYYNSFFENQPLTNWASKLNLFLTGYKKAFAEGQRLGLDVLLGMEIRFNENVNDYLVFGFDESFLQEYKELYKLNLQAFRELTADKGIIIIQAHPFRPMMVPAPPTLIDGVEIYNGNPRHDSLNHLSAQYAQDHGLKMLSGSDFHQPQDAARGGIIIGERISLTGFADVIRQDRIIEFIQTR